MQERRILSQTVMSVNDIPASAVQVDLNQSYSGNVLYIPVFNENKSYRPGDESTPFYFPTYGYTGSSSGQQDFQVSMPNTSIYINGHIYVTDNKNKFILFGGGYTNDKFPPVIGFSSTSSGQHNVFSGSPAYVFPIIQSQLTVRFAQYTTIIVQRENSLPDGYVKLHFSETVTYTAPTYNCGNWVYPVYIDNE